MISKYIACRLPAMGGPPSGAPYPGKAKETHELIFTGYHG